MVARQLYTKLFAAIHAQPQEVCLRGEQDVACKSVRYSMQLSLFSRTSNRL